MVLRPKEYRDRAEECERQAARTHDPNAKGYYLSLAKSWRQLAEQTELIEPSSGKNPSD